MILRRSEEFYASEGIKRRYYYSIDLRGRLFLESVKHRNVATEMKDLKFLRFFYTMMEKNVDSSSADNYKWISKCGKEINFIHCDDSRSSVGFTEIVKEAGSAGAFLIYGKGSMKSPFSSDSLRYCEESGRMYHPVLQHKRLSKDEAYGLLHPELLWKLQLDFVESGGEGGARKSSCTVKWDEQVVPVQPMSHS